MDDPLRSARVDEEIAHTVRRPSVIGTERIRHLVLGHISEGHQARPMDLT
jgi:hypothetical protein